MLFGKNARTFPVPFASEELFGWFPVGQRRIFSPSSEKVKSAQIPSSFVFRRDDAIFPYCLFREHVEKELILGDIVIAAFEGRKKPVCIIQDFLHYNAFGIVPTSLSEPPSHLEDATDNVTFNLE